MKSNSSQKPILLSIRILIISVAALVVGGIIGHLLIRGPHIHPMEPTWSVDGDATQGRAAIIEHGCASCHLIPGVRPTGVRVGPSLDGIRNQIYIAGTLANSPENMAAWIQDPQRFAPGSAMPNLGLTDREARDITAYLYAID